MHDVQQPETISGVIENIVYKNDSNDYTVLEIVDSDNNLITAVGIMAMAFEGETVILSGAWTNHKDFGRQFAFEAYEKKLPDEVDGILQYLSSKTVKGVGPVTALKIVNRFGVDTFDVIENHPEWLADVPGITYKKAAAIAESFREQTGIRNVMMMCKDFLDKSEITRVYKSFGANAVNIIKENPYILCTAENGISFEKADSIGKMYGVSQDSPERVYAGLVYVLEYNADLNGHTCLPREKLQSAASQILGINEDVVTGLLDRFIDSKELRKYSHDETVFIMTSAVYDAEVYINSRVRESEKYIRRFASTDIYAMIEKVENYFGINYAPEQKEAIYYGLNDGIMILTGGPGTGKTTIVKGLISIFKSLDLKCVLSAPTGRAAKRLSEATGQEAKTIHRMLEMDRTDSVDRRFNRDARNPLDEDVVIVDEASMVDLSIMAALFRALRRGSRLILIGDADQLPSVGAGNVFFDMIKSGRIRTVRLSEIFRQSRESLIITNAHRINKGENPILNDTTKDFFFVRRENENLIAETVATLITERLPKTYGKQIKQGIQVITPSKKGAGGTSLLNTELQKRINPSSTFKREVELNAVIYREGDKVMQTANNYDVEWEKNNDVGSGVFNGDIGVIESIDTREEEMKVRFDDRVAKYSFQLAKDELELAYAITVHKSQGSEYPVVILPMYSCPPMLMSRNLLYTAVTRAKKMVIIVGRSDIPARMVANVREVLRYTTLAFFLSEE